MSEKILTREQFRKTQEVASVRKFNELYGELFGSYIPGPGWHHYLSNTAVLFPHYNHDEQMRRGPYRDIEHFLTESTNEDRTISGEAAVLAELITILDSL